jgi:hypothetical protein
VTRRVVSDDRVLERCVDGVACAEVVDRYLASARAHQAGVHEVAETLAAAGDRFAEIHELWPQLEQDVAT